MKVRASQKDGQVGLNGDYWEVKNHIATIPDGPAEMLISLHPDEFQKYEKEVTEDANSNNV